MHNCTSPLNAELRTTDVTHSNVRTIREHLLTYAEDKNEADTVCWIAYVFNMPPEALMMKGLALSAEQLEAAARRVNNYLAKYLTRPPAEVIHHYKLDLLTDYPEEDAGDIALWLGHKQGWPVRRVERVATLLGYEEPVTCEEIEQAVRRVDFYLSHRAHTHFAP